MPFKHVNHHTSTYQWCGWSLRCNLIWIIDHIIKLTPILYIKKNMFKPNQHLAKEQIATKFATILTVHVCHEQEQEFYSYKLYSHTYWLWILSLLLHQTTNSDSLYIYIKWKLIIYKLFFIYDCDSLHFILYLQIPPWGP